MAVASSVITMITQDNPVRRTSKQFGATTAALPLPAGRQNKSKHKFRISKRTRILMPHSPSAGKATSTRVESRIKTKINSDCFQVYFLARGCGEEEGSRDMESRRG
jgi:hypothetical protein